MRINIQMSVLAKLITHLSHPHQTFTYTVLDDDTIDCLKSEIRIGLFAPNYHACDFTCSAAESPGQQVPAMNTMLPARTALEHFAKSPCN